MIRKYEERNAKVLSNKNKDSNYQLQRIVLGDHDPSTFHDAGTEASTFLGAGNFSRSVNFGAQRIVLGDPVARRDLQRWRRPRGALSLRILFIIVMIWWTGLAPWEFDVEIFNAGVALEVLSLPLNLSLAIFPSQFISLPLYIPLCLSRARSLSLYIYICIHI